MGNQAAELHADCQAGMFAAVEERDGLLDVGDVCEAFRGLCAAGDPFESPWFQPGAHGTCEQRTQAFETGYQGMKALLDEDCETTPAAAIQRICG